MVKAGKSELGDYFKKLAEKYDMEEDKVEKEFGKRYDAISKLSSMSMKSDAKKVKRTKAQMSAFFRNLRRNGKPFVFIPFGHTSSPLDWNGKEIKEIFAKAKGGKIPELLRDGKILYKSSSSGKVPVSEVTKWGKRKVYIKGGKVYLKEVDESEEVEEHFVVEGKELKGHEVNVVPRDSRIYVGKKKEAVNFRWSRELKPAFTAEVWGIGFPKDDEDNVRMCHFRLRNDQANPNLSDYFFKKYPAYRPYEADFSFGEPKDNKGAWELSYVGPLNPQNGTIAGVDDTNIDDVIELNLEEIREKYKREGHDTYVPPVIYIDGIKTYHFSTCKMKTDGSGKPQKSLKGWDLTNWGRYAVLLADFERGKYSKERGKSNFYLFSDGDVDYKTGGFGDASQFNMSAIQPSTPVIATVTTSRGPMRYDFKSGARVPDPDNGDINLNVNTIRGLPRPEIEFDDEDDDFEEDD